jgi:flagellar motility protein MotE (MotC chaperone)
LNKLMRRIRLLPIVIVVGLSLLTLKGAGFLMAAQAEGAEGAQPAEALQADAALDPAADPASDDTGLGSAAEVDVLTSLTKRRHELDAREQQLAMRENVITAAEQRVENRITQLQALQVEIQKLLGQRDVEEKAQIDRLVKTYSAMKPKDAARIFNALDAEVLLAVAQQMKADVLAPVLAAMQADVAQKLTLKLADRLKVTPPPPVAAPAPAAPAPDGTTAATMPAAAAPPSAPASTTEASTASPVSTKATTPPPAKTGG